MNAATSPAPMQHLADSGFEAFHASEITSLRHCPGPAGAATNPKLKSKLDHPAGAAQQDRSKRDDCFGRDLYVLFVAKHSLSRASGNDAGA
jgi:hypothetical protein